MKWFICLWSGLLVLSVTGETGACNTWDALPHAALRSLSLCDEPAVERQVGQACVRHEWLCGRGSFVSWFQHWMAEIDEPIIMEKRLGQLIFSGDHHDLAWALFWAPVQHEDKGFAVLVSRIRAVPSKEK
ncbi:hypothetical protein [Orrella daihaiensis]|uniref:Uncharacterized protein n=1 Tax=Orrella daihaiensis TaxID=2782176 RepID=A0ABY4AK43_9BURK|nr:hypothetical protein [Orrella daihaiensis]UOD49432.1 hypothetical protein DHf2319_08025 [Orrella daihaiensis]